VLQDLADALGVAVGATRRPPRPARPRPETMLTGDRPAGRWLLLAVVAAGILLAMAPWLSSSAVAGSLRAEWGLRALDITLLTVAVQLGFAAGAIALASLGVPDVVPTRTLFLLGALVAAGANLAFALVATDLLTGLPLRFATGLGLAAVYPVALRLVVGWFRVERGLAVGTLIGAITVGTALPYLVAVLGGLGGVDWRMVVTAASGLAATGGVLVFRLTREGPFDQPAPRFSISVALRALRQPAVRLASLGYFGHMWELYAMWSLIPLFLASSFAASGAATPDSAALLAFVVVAAGGGGCVLAGLLADRFGRTATTIGAMAVSGLSALAAGALFAAPPAVVALVALIWGVSIVADSAQFSAAVSELAPPGTAGSALALQLAGGFILTAISIGLIGLIDPGDGSGWRIAFWSLAVGPAVGILAMWRLRSRPEAVLLAGGRR
jgi:MFS family permease